MAIFGLFKPRKPRPEQRLYESVLSAARNPAFYDEGGADDTVDGRFEILALHMAIAYRRLNALDEAFAQAFFDAFVKDMDVNLRELGVGDARFGKKMKHIVQSLYGRIQAYGAALGDADEEAVRAVLTRNGSDVIGAAGLDGFPRYALAADREIGAAPIEAFSSAGLPWPDAAGACVKA